MNVEYARIYLEFLASKDALNDILPTYTETGLHWSYSHDSNFFAIKCYLPFDNSIAAKFELYENKWRCVEPGGYSDRIDEMLKIIINHFGE
jgi:hypothetical protein